MPPRPRSKVTDSQAAFIDAKLEGATDHAAALAAGQNHAGSLSKSSTIKEQLTIARRWLTETTQIKRLDVIEGIVDSIEMGRFSGDPAAVRQGWVEIGKILGHYAPEVKRIELSMEHSRLRTKFESLSDEDLLALQQGATIEGECTEVRH